MHLPHMHITSYHGIKSEENNVHIVLTMHRIYLYIMVYPSIQWYNVVDTSTTVYTSTSTMISGMMDECPVAVLGQNAHVSDLIPKNML